MTNKENLHYLRGIAIGVYIIACTLVVDVSSRDNSFGVTTSIIESDQRVYWDCKFIIAEPSKNVYTANVLAKCKLKSEGVEQESPIITPKDEDGNTTMPKLAPVITGLHRTDI